MTLVKITTENPEDLFKSPEFPVLPAGRHLFVVANELEVSQSSGDDPKDMIKLEARCQDEDENKGVPVFDNFLVIASPRNDKEETAKKIHDAKLAQFVVACGVKTREELSQGMEFDLAELNGKFFQAISKVSLVNVYPEELDEHGKPKKVARASIKQYLFEPETTAPAQA